MTKVPSPFISIISTTQYLLSILMSECVQYNRDIGVMEKDINKAHREMKLRLQRVNLVHQLLTSLVLRPLVFEKVNSRLGVEATSGILRDLWPTFVTVCFGELRSAAEEAGETHLIQSVSDLVKELEPGIYNNVVWR